MRKKEKHFTIKFCTKLWSKIRIRPIGWISSIHKFNNWRSRTTFFPIYPHPTISQTILSQFFSSPSTTYHSVPYDGMLYNPQWRNIPILLSSYHPGNGRVSNDDQLATYCCSLVGREHTHRKNTTNASILQRIFYTEKLNWHVSVSIVYIYIYIQRCAGLIR